MNEFDVKEEKQELWDAEAIYKHLVESITWVYNKNETNTEVIAVSILPESLVRKYIENEEIVKEILSFWFVVWHLRFMPNRLFKEDLERFRINNNKNWVDKSITANQIKAYKDFFKNTKENRYLNKLNKFWEVERKYTSYKQAIYIWTTTKIFNDYWRSFFNPVRYNADGSLNAFAFQWNAPYLVIDTNKNKFAWKLMKFWLKDLVKKLKELARAIESLWFESDDIDTFEVREAKKELYLFLEKPFKEIIDDDLPESEKDDELIID